jgi:redox-sensitive bicupin YhaK (pirin superfamily)
MKAVRPIKRISRSRVTIEGAGVRLKRAFGNADVPLFDPFLMLDDFHSDQPEDYIPGFPWHPHRGIETVTYMISGIVEHGDSMGNKGAIHSGDVQWMTAGNGIIHQEMPQRQKGTLWGLQLWVNLPANHKMMAPRYRGIESRDIPEIRTAEGVSIKVLAGRVSGVNGPVKDIVTNPEYLDVHVPAGTVFEHPISLDHNAFAYVLEGKGIFGPGPQKETAAEHLVLFGEGDSVSVQALQEGLRFILVSGKPIGEPVAWRGPIVMNTEEELALAFEEYRNGTFIKK